MDTATKPVPSSHGVGEVLTVKEAAEFLLVNVKTIHKLLASGDLPHHRFGRVIRIPSRVLLSTRKSV
jgi:excisionase family DNA binding protein